MELSKLAFAATDIRYRTKFVLENVEQMLKINDGYKVLIELFEQYGVHLSEFNKLINSKFSFDRCLFIFEKQLMPN